MAKGQKIFKITKVVLNNMSLFEVGQQLTVVGFLAGGVNVTEITFNRADKAYNSGLQLPGASYTIQLADETRILIPLDSVNYIAGTWVEAKKNADNIPELPEA